MSFADMTPGKVCAPLMAAAGALLYLRNPFRVTGLPVDVSVRDISRQASRLQMMLELGQQSDASTQSVFPLDPQPTLDEVREAVEKIKDPQNRLVSEFFWLWPEQWGQSRTDAALQAWNSGDGEMALRFWTLKEEETENALVASHNLAVFWHLVALDWEKRLADMEIDQEMARTVEEYWQMSAKRWSALLANEAFWELIATRIQQINDPRLTPAFGSALKMSLPGALVKINAELALRHVEAGHRELAAMHVRLLKGMIPDISRIQDVLESVFGPTINRLQQQVTRVRESSEVHPEFAGRSAKDLVEQVFPLFSLYRLIHGQESQHSTELFYQTAVTCTNAAVAHYRTTKDNAALIGLLEKVLPMADSPELRQRIELNISIGKTNQDRDRYQPLFEMLEKVQSSDGLFKSKLWRIRDQIVPQINAIPPKEKSSNPVVTELHDAVASQLWQLASDALQYDKDRDTASEAVELGICLARRLDIKEQLLSMRRDLPLANPIAPTVVPAPARQLSVETLNSRLLAIQGTTLPADRLLRIKNEILGKHGSDKWDLAAEDLLAVELRKLSLLAFNEYSDAETAWEAIELAVNRVHDPQTADQIREDSCDLARVRAILDSDMLQMSIRDDVVQVTAQKIRFKETVWSTSSVLGYRWGENGEERRSHRLDIQNLNGERITIDCKRFLRSERKVAEDFEQLTRAFHIHLAPQIAWRAARHILSGQSYPLSSSQGYDFVHEPATPAELRVTADSVCVAHFPGIPLMEIPLADAVVEWNERGCFLRSQSAPPIRVCSLWNGPCLEQILKTLRNAKNGKLSSYARHVE